MEAGFFFPQRKGNRPCQSARTSGRLIGSWPTVTLAVFNARLYVRVRHLDEPAERCGVYGRFRSQFHMAHELAVALQQARRIRQRRAVKEPHIYVRSEYIDVAEGRIAQTCNRTAVMQSLPDFVPALSHHLKPLMRDGSQCTAMLFHPSIDGGIAFDCTVESQQVRSHRRPIFACGSMLRGTPARGTKGWLAISQTDVFCVSSARRAVRNCRYSGSPAPVFAETVKWRIPGRTA